MQTTLAQFNETQSQEAFALQNSKLLKVRLDQVTIQSKLGSMVAYQGDVTFEHAGSGGLGRMLKKAMTGEGAQLMKVTGSGEVFLADQAQDIHLIYLEDDFITVNGRNLLAFDAGIDWDIKRVEGASGVMGGGLYNLALRGTGWVAILSDGPPVLLNVASAPTFADAQAAITWSSGVTTGIRTDFKMKNLVGRGSGETFQMSFSGQGWVLVQPSEGRILGLGQEAGGGGGGAGLAVEFLDVDDLVAGVFDRLLAGRAPPARLERGPARLVPVRLAAAGACAPVGEQPQRARELAAGLGQLVDEARRTLGVGRGDDQRLLGKRLEAGAEDVGRDPLELVLELVEAAWAVEQGGDREEGPAVADSCEGVGEGGGGGAPHAVEVTPAAPGDR